MSMGKEEIQVNQYDKISVNPLLGRIEVYAVDAWEAVGVALTPTQATQLITLLSKAIKEIEEKT